MSEAIWPWDAAREEGLKQREKALAHMPELIPGTPEIRCGTCRFRLPKGGVLADAGMGICGRYRGSLTLYTRGHSEACWHHQPRPSSTRRKDTL